MVPCDFYKASRKCPHRWTLEASCLSIFSLPSFLLFTEGQLVLIPVLACVSSEVLACTAKRFLKTNNQTKPGVHFGWGRCFLHILSQAQKEPGLTVCKLFALHSGSSVCVCVC